MTSREGNDAKDADGNEYELKTVNIPADRKACSTQSQNPSIQVMVRLENLSSQDIYRLKFIFVTIRIFGIVSLA